MSKAAVFLLTLTLLASFCGYSQPKIQIVEGIKIDFGDIYNSEKMTRELTVKNLGTDTLRVKDVRAQCGCTATLLAKKNIAPKDSGKLSITFNPYGYNDGKYTKHVYIDSNDPKDSLLTIEFTVSLSSVLSFEPSMFSFPSAKIDTTYKSTIIIKNISKENIKITSFKSNVDLLTVILKKNQIKPGETAELEGTFRTSKSGTFSGTVEFTTDHKVLPRVELRFFAWVTRK